MQEVKRKMSQVTELIKGVWTCKVCGKTATKQYNIEAHAETHMSGQSFACNFLDCGKTFWSKNAFYVHKSISHRASKRIV